MTAPSDQEIFARWRDEPAPLLGVLQAFHDRDGFLSEEVLRAVARELRIPIAELFGTVTFYRFFRRRPPAKPASPPPAAEPKAASPVEAPAKEAAMPAQTKRPPPPLEEVKPRPRKPTKKAPVKNGYDKTLARADEILEVAEQPVSSADVELLSRPLEKNGGGQSTSKAADKEKATEAPADNVVDIQPVAKKTAAKKAAPAKKTAARKTVKKKAAAAAKKAAAKKTAAKKTAAKKATANKEPAKKVTAGGAKKTGRRGIRLKSLDADDGLV